MVRTRFCHCRMWCRHHIFKRRIASACRSLAFKCGDAVRDSRSCIPTLTVLCPLMLPAPLQQCLWNMFSSRFNRKNTFCSYRRDNTCVGLRDAVETNELLAHLVASPIHRMVMTACPTILYDGQKLHTNRIGCVVSASKIIYKTITLAFIIATKRRHKINTKKNFKNNYRLDYWSDHSRTNRTVCYGPAQ